MKIKSIIKIVLSLGFFICLLDMPYAYYQFIRFIGLIGFSFLAFKANEKNHKNQVFIYIGLALLFQPFFKLAFGRFLWNVIDIVVGLGLFITLFINKKIFEKLE